MLGVRVAMKGRVRGTARGVLEVDAVGQVVDLLVDWILYGSRAALSNSLHQLLLLLLLLR